MRIRKLFAVALALGACWAGASCGDEAAGEHADSLQSRCGNGVCESSACETPLRCPSDCGTCSGPDCEPFDSTARSGTCGKLCFNSCGCAQPGEVCTADLDGSAEGTCVPVGCGICPAGQSCQYEVDADGRCEAGQCG